MTSRAEAGWAAWMRLVLQLIEAGADTRGMAVAVAGFPALRSLREGRGSSFADAGKWVHVLRIAASSIVTEVSPPSQSRLADWYRGADLLDAFAVQIPTSVSSDVRSIGEVVLGQQAPWFKV